jgi:phage terminase large subunit-like protein
MEIVEPVMSNCTFTFDLQIPLGMDSAGVTVTNTAIWSGVVRFTSIPGRSRT